MKSKDSSSLLQGQPKGWRTTGRCNAVWEHLEGVGFVCNLITHPPLTTLMDIVSCRSHDVASKTSPRTSVLLPHIPGRSKMNIYKEIRTKNDARILPPRIYFNFIFFYSIRGQKEKEKQFMNLKNSFWLFLSGANWPFGLLKASLTQPFTFIQDLGTSTSTILG